VHNVVSSKTASREETVKRIEEKLSISKPGFQQDPRRWFEVNIAAWFAENPGISFNAFQSDRWRTIAAMLPVPIGPGTALGSINIRKHSIELYSYVVGMIQEHVELSRKCHRGLPFASFNIDLYRNKFTKTKYFASRVSFTVSKQRHSFNLGIRAFNPTYLERVEIQASDLLVNWLGDVCATFGFDMAKDIFTMSGDHGPDVSRAMDVVTDGQAEWCIAHLLDRVLRDAFGSSIDPAKSKNPTARAVINLVRKTLETVNKSEALGAAFNEKSLEELGRTLSAKNDALHRWSSVEGVLKSALYSFAPMGSAFVTHQGSFPLANEKQVMVEFYSVVYELRKVQKRSQAMKDFVVAEVYIQMVVLYFGVMQSTKALPIHDPSPRVVQLDAPPPEPELRLPCDLDPRTTIVRQKLLQGASARYFNRYNAFAALRNPSKFYGPRSSVDIHDACRSDFKFSYLFDIVSALWPGMSDGVVLQKLIDAPTLSDELLAKFNKSSNGSWTVQSIRANHFAMIQNYIWSSIRGMALKVAVHRIREQRAKGVVMPLSSRESNPRKRKRDVNSVEQMNSLLGLEGGVDEIDYDPEPNEDDGTDDIHVVATKMVDAEIALFKSIPKSACPDPAKYADWWMKSDDTKDLACLSVVTSSLSALKVGSGGLECDIGVMVDLVTPKRASIGKGFVEALSFLKLNKELIPFDPTLIPPLPNSSWKSSIPGNGTVAPFTLQDLEDCLDDPDQTCDDDESDSGSDYGDVL
jgi:hypothetical protein